MIVINTGATANDGTGDKLRDAFIIVNQNFLDIQDILDVVLTDSSIIPISQISGLQTILDDLSYQVSLIPTLQDDINSINSTIFTINQTLNSQNSSINELYSLVNDLQQQIFTKIGEAPIDGQQYVRQDAEWVVSTGVTFSQLLENVTPDGYLGLRLQPASASNNGFYINKSTNQSVGYYARNTDNVGNGAVSALYLGGSGGLYDNYVSLFHANAGYSIPYLRNKNGLISNNDLFFIGWQGASFDFVTSTGTFGSETSKFRITNSGTVSIGVTPSLDNTTTDILGRKADGTIVRIDKSSIVDDIPTKTSQLVNDGDNGTSHFISLEDLPSTLTLYPTTATSSIGGYNTLVTSITDPVYNTTAVDITTGAITGTDQFIAGLITEPGLIIGNPGVFNMTTIGNIRKTSGSGQAEFYFTVYKRDAAGTETLILQSSNTPQITSAIYTEFNASGLWNDGIFISTDRIVLKFYGTKIGSGSNPTYDFQFGGTAPVRSIVPVPLNVIPVLSLDELTDVTIIGTPSNNSLLVYGTSSVWENRTLEEIGGSINIISDGLPGTPVTGPNSFTQVLIKSYRIPANTFAAGDTLEIWTMGSKIGTNTAWYVGISKNTSNSLVGSTELVRTYSGNTVIYLPLQRIFNIASGSTIKVINSTNNLENATTVALSTTTFDVTIDNYLLFTVTPVTGGTADLMNIERVIIRKNKYKVTV